MIDIEKIDLENLPPYGSPEHKELVDDLKKDCRKKYGEYEEARALYNAVKRGIKGYQGKFFRIFHAGESEEDKFAVITYIYAKRAYMSDDEIVVQGMNFQWGDSDDEDKTYVDFSWLGNIYVSLDKLETMQEITKEEYSAKFSLMCSTLKNKFDEYFRIFEDKEE